jgi:hypothetical protein
MKVIFWFFVKMLGRIVFVPFALVMFFLLLLTDVLLGSDASSKLDEWAVKVTDRLYP